jgi:hypothetical protein
VADYDVLVAFRLVENKQDSSNRRSLVKTAGDIYSTPTDGYDPWLQYLLDNQIIGEIPEIMTVDEFTGDGATVLFTLTATPVASGLVYVAQNGQIVLPDSYALVDDEVTFDVAPVDTTDILVGYLTVAVSGATYALETFTGDDVTTDFELAHTPSSVVFVALNGQVLGPTLWSVVDTTFIRFVTAPPDTQDVLVGYLW